MKKKIFILLVVIFIAHLLFRIYEYREAYLTPFDAGYWTQKYENSQWSTKPACENLDPHVNPYTCVWDDQWYAENKLNPEANNLKRNVIGDDAVYAYAGWEYIHGHDPTTLNAELPPFGKYLIGLSELIFYNQNIFALLSGIFALLALYLLNTAIIRDKFYAFIPVFIFSFEPLVYTQFRTTLLDLLYLGLLCICLYFIIKKHFIRSAIFFGLLAATKSSASTFMIGIGVVAIYLLATKQYGALKRYFLSLPIAGIVFLMSYTQYFLLGNSLIEFLGVQKWIINFYAIGAKGSLIAPLEIIFTGQYHNWWNEKSIVQEWHLGWPLLFLSSFLALIFLKKRYMRSPVLLLALWVIVYFMFLSFVPVWSRYFLLILPFMYTLTVWGILTFAKNASDNINDGK